MITYHYCKRCKVCKARYFNNEISKQQFEMLSENENISISVEGNKHIAEISSVCEEHTAEYYKNTQ